MIVQFSSVPFASLIVLGLSLYHACRSQSQRLFVLLLLNAVFLSSQVDSIKALAPMTAFLAFSLLAIHLVNLWKSRVLFLACLVAVVGSFVYLKRYLLASFLPPLPLAYLSVGLSYIVFRVIHLLVDTYHHERRRDDLKAVSLLNYFTSFLSLTAGPLQRYEDYRRQEAACDQGPVLTAAQVLGALARLANGYLLLAFVGPALLGLHNHLFAEQARHLLAFAGTAALWILYVYVNFAGYMDIVIGLARLFGFELPENFNAPFLCANFLDLWNRWHITLSSWFRDYVFAPLVGGLYRRFEKPNLLPYFGVLAYFLVFFLLGVWHGSDARYVVLGLYFGFGASVNKLFQVELARRLGPERLQALWERGWYRALARAVALSFFAFAEAVIWEKVPDMPAYGGMLSGLGAARLAVNFGALVGVIMAIEAVVRLTLGLWRRVAPAVPRLIAPLAGGPLGLGVRVVLLLLLVSKAIQPAAPTEAVAPASTATAARPPSATDVFYGRF
jgi:D-alanyl-lipoteichoic acid acyltransferase DltB (MBOAT superfamily)